MSAPPPARAAPQRLEAREAEGPRGSPAGAALPATPGTPGCPGGDPAHRGSLTRCGGGRSPGRGTPSVRRGCLPLRPKARGRGRPNLRGAGGVAARRAEGSPLAGGPRPGALCPPRRRAAGSRRALPATPRAPGQSCRPASGATGGSGLRRARPVTARPRQPAGARGRAHGRVPARPRASALTPTFPPGRGRPPPIGQHGRHSGPREAGRRCQAVSFLPSLPGPLAPGVSSPPPAQPPTTARLAKLAASAGSPCPRAGAVGAGAAGRSGLEAGERWACSARDCEPPTRLDLFGTADQMLPA